MITLLIALFALSEVPTPAAPAPTVVSRIAPGVDGAVELVLIGDTGEAGPLVERWKVALRAEAAPAVLVLGDLVYPQAPPCPTGVPSASARRILDQVVHAPLSATGKEVFLVVGNHDISWDAADPPRHACLLSRFARDPQVRLPARYYAVDLDLALLVVLDTNALDDAQAAFARAIVQAYPGRRVIFAGHHVLRTYHDKIDEDLVQPWLARHQLAPDFWVNGHAHVLQMVERDGIFGITSGTASKPRERPACDRLAGTGQCGERQLWGSSTPGYAVLRVEPASPGKRVSVTFKDVDGKPLWRWSEPVAPRVAP
jgi:predicted phosphodiesterase